MGYIATVYWHKFKKNYVLQPNKRRELRGVYMATIDRQRDKVWYLDNSTINYIPKVIRNLNFNSEYQVMINLLLEIVINSQSFILVVLYYPP